MQRHKGSAYLFGFLKEYHAKGIGNGTHSQYSGSKVRSDASSVARLGCAVKLPEHYSGVRSWLLKVTRKVSNGLEYVIPLSFCRPMRFQARYFSKHGFSTFGDQLLQYYVNTDRFLSQWAFLRAFFRSFTQVHCFLLHAIKYIPPLSLVKRADVGLPENTKLKDQRW